MSLFSDLYEGEARDILRQMAAEFAVTIQAEMIKRLDCEPLDIEAVQELTRALEDVFDDHAYEFTSRLPEDEADAREQRQLAEADSRWMDR